MNRDDIIRMAQEAHKDLVTVDYPGHVGQLDPWTLRLLERFAALVAAAAEQTKPEPVGVMQESYIMEGLVIPVVTQELPVGTPLYAALVTAETGKEIAALREDNERLRADAERYRWHRANIAKHMGHSLKVIDAATDAEMKEAALRREKSP